MRDRFHLPARRATLLLVSLALLPSCSVRRTALRLTANALTGSGGVYASDDDPELIAAAIPFGLKTYEGLLEELPEHEGLLLACASGFTQYAYAFVQDEADVVDPVDVERARQMRARAAKLYLRARDYGLRGLALRHAEVNRRLHEDRAALLHEMGGADVPFLYWTAAAWAGALSAAKDDLDLVAELPIAGTMMERVIALDEGWDDGAAHAFMITYEGSRSDAMGGSRARARDHYRRAVELSAGKLASPHLSLAESVCVAEQDAGEFRRLVALALAVDVDAAPAHRLANTVAQRRARWLLTRIDELFLDASDDEADAAPEENP